MRGGKKGIQSTGCFSWEGGKKQFQPPPQVNSLTHSVYAIGGANESLPHSLVLHAPSGQGMLTLCSVTSTAEEEVEEAVHVEWICKLKFD